MSLEQEALKMPTARFRARKIIAKAVLACVFACSILFAGSLQIGSLTKGSIIMLTSGMCSTSQDSLYTTALGSIGFRVRVMRFTEVRNLDLAQIRVLIVPGDVTRSLGGEIEDSIVAAVRRGLFVITERPSPFSEKLGIKSLDRCVPVHAIADNNHPKVQINWQGSLQVTEIDTSNLRVFCYDRRSGLPIVVGRRLGEGKFIYLGIPLDKNCSSGYGRFPYFHETFVDFFGLRPSVRRDRLVAYLDWGYHEKSKPLELANRIKDYGISEVHVSAWYSLDQCEDFYRKFLDLCHANGILVYVWLELPMVTEEFWNRHPEWRQKTAKGQDAFLDWRKLMALEIPECFDSVTSHVKKIIDTFDWDGIDVAELYFDSPDGIKRLSAFTPFSDFVRNDFKTRFGIDPFEIFNPDSPHYYLVDKKALRQFLEYRVELCTRLNRQMMEFIRTQQARRKLDVYLTQIDNTVDKNVRDAIGVDINEYVKLQKEFGFTLQAEDPSSLWALGPDRYKKIGRLYRKLLGPGTTFTIDINVVAEGRDQIYPTKMQTGLEFLELLSEASRYSDRVCIYAVHTPYAYDYSYAPYALATMAVVTEAAEDEFLTNSPKTFILETETASKDVFINGRPWPCRRKNGIIIPPGRNSVKIQTSKTNHSKKLSITGISCEIEECMRVGRDIDLKYDERRNVFVTLNRRPCTIYVNDNEVSLQLFYNSFTDEFTVQCPIGQNRIRFVDGEPSGTLIAINGRVVALSEEPLVVKDLIFCPVKEILESVGALTSWNSKTKAFSANLNGLEYSLQIGNAVARANGKDVKLGTAPFIKNGKVMSPITLMYDPLSYEVSWASSKRLLLVQSK